jgi:histidinol-phosphate aminotransferase
MKPIPNLIRRHIQELPPYNPIYPLEVLSEELGLEVSQLIKLDANENPFGPLPQVKEALASMESIHIYPDPESRQIRRLLAEQHNIAEESIVIGAGADELIDLIMRVVLEPGDPLLNCPPTFGMYAFDGALNQGQIIEVPRTTDFSLDVPALISAVEKHQPRLLFLAHPNNPDGGILSQEEFESLIALPLLLVIDEAYIQFAGEGASFLSQVQDHSNLIVLQTFSKWAGLAGLRIGYGVFPPNLVPSIMKAKQPYNVSCAAETAAIVTMRNLQLAHSRIDRIIAQRDPMIQALAAISWLQPYPSRANFILCRVLHGSAESIKDQLRQQGILIRYFDKPGLSDHIRFSIGTEAQNARLLAALEGMNPT